MWPSKPRGYLLVLAGRMSGQLGVLYGIGARVGGWCWARLRKFAHPTSGDRANLRKYALETSPVADCENMHSAKIILYTNTHAKRRELNVNELSAPGQFPAKDRKA